MTESAARIDSDAAPHLDEDYVLSPEFLRSVVDALDSRKDEAVRELIAPLHVADLADLLELLRSHERRALIAALGDTLDPEVLSELEEDVRDDVLKAMSPQLLAEAVAELDNDDAVYLLEDLEESRQQEILAQVPDKERMAVEMGLQYPEYSAGRLMQRDVIGVPDFWTVGQMHDFVQAEKDTLPDEFYEVFVVDPTQRPVGSVLLSQLLKASRETALTGIMVNEPILIPATMEQEEAAYLFQQYHLVSAPVIDEAGRLVGMLTVDDIIDVIQDENREDVLALGGVGDEGLSDNVVTTTRRRFSWLFVNLITAVLASLVIAQFDATIQQMVALAILMPIVASMGGNAGTQTLTVAVRAMATRDLTPANTLRIVMREGFVGSLNGLLFAVIMGAVAFVWFQDMGLGLVVGVAMIINMAVAGLSGIMIPLTLQRFGADPALASTVFVTTVTDIAGFFVFLGLASLILAG